MRTRDKLRRVVPAGTNMYKYVVNYDNGQFNFAIIKLLTLEPGIVANNPNDEFKICRVPKVYVTDVVAATDSGIDTWYSTFDATFIYRIKEIAVARDYNGYIWNTCGAGINCFATVKETLAYINLDIGKRLEVKKDTLCEVLTK